MFCRASGFEELIDRRQIDEVFTRRGQENEYVEALRDHRFGVKKGRKRAANGSAADQACRLHSV